MRPDLNMNLGNALEIISKHIARDNDYREPGVKSHERHEMSLVRDDSLSDTLGENRWFAEYRGIPEVQDLGIDAINYYVLHKTRVFESAEEAVIQLAKDLEDQA